MLGNDVVDLFDVDARPETFHRRFDTRVFAPEERGAIAADPRPEALRWAHWGAKEAAYKLARQLDPKFVFSPARLVARFEVASRTPAGSFERRGRLELASGPPGRVQAIDLKSFETREWVHVVALAAGSDWGAVVMAVEPLRSQLSDSEASHAEDASLAVRRLALREIGHELELAAGRLSIGREGRIPTVELDGQATDFALSLSHHGRFVAFAMAPRGRLGVRGVRDLRGERREHGDGGEHGDFGARRQGVRQTAGAVGCPVGAADTAWPPSMIGWMVRWTVG